MKTKTTQQQASDLKCYYIRTIWDGCLVPEEQLEPESLKKYNKLYDWLEEFGWVDIDRDQLVVFFYATLEGAEAVRDAMIEETKSADYFDSPVECFPEKWE